MGAELPGDGRYGGEDVPVQLRVLPAQAPQPFCSARREASGYRGWTGYDNLLAFVNPDQSVVIMMQNELCQALPVRVKAGDKVIAATLEADSFNTFVVRA